MRKLTKYLWVLVVTATLAVFIGSLVPAQSVRAQATEPELEILGKYLADRIGEICINPTNTQATAECVAQYEQWVDDCNNISSSVAEQASGNKNTAYENRFAACLSSRANNKITESQIKNLLPNDIYDQVTEAAASGEEAKEAESCESTGGSLAWMLCPALTLIDGAAGTLADQIEELLNVDSDRYTHESIENTWRSMRNIALLILVPMMLFMVIGTALEFGPFDAYTVKKALPRMFIAVMFIVLSLEITQFFVNLSNVIGRGMEGIILSATGNPESLSAYYSASGGALFSLLAGGGIVVGIATGAITLGIFGSLALVTLVALFIGYMVLVLRELLILALIAVAPLAILVWIFPGNDKIWKIWRTTFTAMLMMFPLIVILITMGKVFAGLIDDTQNDFTAYFLKVVAYVAPFFFIPATFKYGLGVFGNLAGVINDRSRGIFDRQRKYREGARANARQQAKLGNRFASGTDDNFLGRVNRGISTGMVAPGAIASRGVTKNWRTSTRTQQAADKIAAVERAMKENPYAQPIMYDDGLMRAAAETKNAGELRSYLRTQIEDQAKEEKRKVTDLEYRAVEDNVNAVEAFRRSVDADTFDIFATRQALAGGTAFKTTKADEKAGRFGIAAGEAWAAVGKASKGNDAVLQYLVANGRKEGEGAGRMDYASAGFGTTYNQAKRAQLEYMQTGAVSEATIQSISDNIHEDVYRGNGGAALVYSKMKPDSVKEMAGQMVISVDERRAAAVQAQNAANDPTLVGQAKQDAINNQIKAERGFTQSLASMAAVYDGMQSSSPNKAEIVADTVLGRKIMVKDMSPTQRQKFSHLINNYQRDPATGKTVIDPSTGQPKIESQNTSITYQQAIEAMRSDQEFVEMRREYSSRYAAEQGAAAVQAQQSGNTPGAPGGP